MNRDARWEEGLYARLPSRVEAGTEGSSGADGSAERRKGRQSLAACAKRGSESHTDESGDGRTHRRLPPTEEGLPRPVLEVLARCRRNRVGLRAPQEPERVGWRCDWPRRRERKHARGGRRRRRRRRREGRARKVRRRRGDGVKGRRQRKRRARASTRDGNRSRQGRVRRVDRRRRHARPTLGGACARAAALRAATPAPGKRRGESLLLGALLLLGLFELARARRTRREEVLPRFVAASEFGVRPCTVAVEDLDIDADGELLGRKATEAIDLRRW